MAARYGCAIGDCIETGGEATITGFRARTLIRTGNDTGILVVAEQSTLFPRMVPSLVRRACARVAIGCRIAAGSALR